MDIIDYVLIGGVAYYAMTKIRVEHDDGAKRALLGIGAGLLVGYKGPEIYDKFVNMRNTPEGAVLRNKLIAAGIAAGAGYLFGDKIIDSASKLVKR